jgi:hypothetical protein
VVTVLSRMFDKGILRRTKQGRSYVYTPVADAPPEPDDRPGTARELPPRRLRRTPSPR